MKRASTAHRAARRVWTGPAGVLLFVWLSFLPLLAPDASPAGEREPPMDPVFAQGRQSGRFRSGAEQWKGMNPEEKQTLRRRMDRWNRMDPEERQRYRHRYDQWKGLSPEEQQRIDDKLERWKGLSPAEKEDVRRRFR